MSNSVNREDKNFFESLPLVNKSFVADARAEFNLSRIKRLASITLLIGVIILMVALCLFAIPSFPIMVPISIGSVGAILILVSGIFFLRSIIRHKNIIFDKSNVFFDAIDRLKRISKLDGLSSKKVQNMPKLQDNVFDHLLDPSVSKPDMEGFFEPASEVETVIDEEQKPFGSKIDFTGVTDLAIEQANPISDIIADYHDIKNVTLSKFSVFMQELLRLDELLLHTGRIPKFTPRSEFWTSMVELFKIKGAGDVLLEHMIQQMSDNSLGDKSLMYNFIHSLLHVKESLAFYYKQKKCGFDIFMQACNSILSGWMLHEDTKCSIVKCIKEVFDEDSNKVSLCLGLLERGNIVGCFLECLGNDALKQSFLMHSKGIDLTKIDRLASKVEKAKWIKERDPSKHQNRYYDLDMDLVLYTKGLYKVEALDLNDLPLIAGDKQSIDDFISKVGPKFPDKMSVTNITGFINLGNNVKALKTALKASFKTLEGQGKFKSWFSVGLYMIRSIRKHISFLPRVGSFIKSIGTHCMESLLILGGLSVRGLVVTSDILKDYPKTTDAVVQEIGASSKEELEDIINRGDFLKIFFPQFSK